MNIHNKSSVIEFGRKHSDCREQLQLWFNDVSSMQWKKRNDVKKDFVTASVIGNNRVVFNIKGNKYRLIAEMNYLKGWAFIKFIGTHAAYDAVEAETIDRYKSQRK